jgi:hypothetical protein
MLPWIFPPVAVVVAAAEERLATAEHQAAVVRSLTLLVAGQASMQGLMPAWDIGAPTVEPMLEFRLD